MEIGKIDPSQGDHSLIQPRPAKTLPGRGDRAGGLISDRDQVSFSDSSPSRDVDRYVARLLRLADSGDRSLEVHRQRLEADTLVHEETLREAARRILES